jgi:hypothetical protein
MKILILTCTILLSQNIFSYSATQTFAWTLAQTIFVTGLGSASLEVTSGIVSSKQAKKEARFIQDEIQNYFQSEEISPVLANKISIIKNSYPEFSTDESIDLLLDCTKIILDQ